MTFNKGLNKAKKIERLMGDIVTKDGLQIDLEQDSDLIKMLQENTRAYLNGCWQGSALEKWLSTVSKRQNIKLDTLRCIYPKGGEYFFPSISTDELLRNSVEHGADFGTLGSITIRGEVGRAILLTIDDPGEGFNFSPLGSWFKSRRHAYTGSFRRPGSHGRLRGTGLEGVNRFKDVDVWFEKLVRGFRTKILFSNNGQTIPRVIDARPKSLWI